MTKKGVEIRNVILENLRNSHIDTEFDIGSEVFESILLEPSIY